MPTIDRARSRSSSPAIAGQDLKKGYQGFSKYDILIVGGLMKPTLKDIKIDDCDRGLLDMYKYEIKKNRNYYYAERRFNRADGTRSKTSLHRDILGEACKNMLVDHINKNPLDNRRCNLRVVTVSQNAMNQAKQKNRSSKYKGVNLDKEKQHHAKKWRAQIKKEGKRIHLGRFLTEKEAAEAYNKAALELFGDFASLNVIE